MKLLVTGGAGFIGSNSEQSNSVKLTVTVLKKEYLENKLTSYEIGEKYGYSATWINILRKRFKIPALKPYQRNKIQEFSEIQKEYLYGSLLGDDCLKNPPYCKNAYLSVSHNKDQKAYVEFKFSLLRSFVKSGIKFSNDKREGRKGQFWFKTISHPVFTQIYKQIYKLGRKTISHYWFKQLTPFSLAVWYMDDGSLARSNRQMRISAESFSKQELLWLRDFLKKRWNILPRVVPSNREGKHVLLFPAIERDKFFSLIRPLITSQMHYKLCEQSRWKKWSHSEIEFLKRNYSGRKKNWEKLALLNHSKAAIARKAAYLGVN